MKGFTLVEVMIALGILFIITATVMLVLLQAYKMTILTRHSDNARAALATFADQFTQLSPYHPDGTIRDFWQETNTDTGSGMTPPDAAYPTDVYLSPPPLWRNPDGSYPAYNPANGIPITLGSVQAVNNNAQSGSVIEAFVFRRVRYVAIAADGTSTEEPFGGPKTNVLSATFTINFTVNGQAKTQTLTVGRDWVD